MPGAKAGKHRIQQHPGKLTGVLIPKTLVAGKKFAVTVTLKDPIGPGRVLKLRGQSSADGVSNWTDDAKVFKERDASGFRVGELPRGVDYDTVVLTCDAPAQHKVRIVASVHALISHAAVKEHELESRAATF